MSITFKALGRMVWLAEGMSHPGNWDKRSSEEVIGRIDVSNEIEGFRSQINTNFPDLASMADKVKWGGCFSQEEIANNVSLMQEIHSQLYSAYRSVDGKMATIHRILLYHKKYPAHADETEGWTAIPDEWREICQLAHKVQESKDMGLPLFFGINVLLGIKNREEYLNTQIHTVIQRLQQMVDAAKSRKPREISKPIRVNQWHRLFVAAKYSENESLRSFRRFLNEQLVSGTASRETVRGAVCFELAFLAKHKVKVPAD